jgi:thiol-disulfide isomerase/thioredoxin
MIPRALPLVLLAACATSQTPAFPTTRVSLRLDRPDVAPLTLGELRGRVVLLTVINTWADPALLEIPRLKALYAKHGDSDLTIICVVLGEVPQMIRIFRETFEIPYAVAFVSDPALLVGENGPLGKITTVPTTFLIDREGYIAARMEGMWAPELLEEAVEELIAK